MHARARALSGKAVRPKKRGRQSCLSRLAPLVTRVVICVSRAFCSTNQEKRDTARGLAHNREFNRLEQHSSHDLVFKIWRNNKTKATWEFFVSDCELLVTNSQWVPPEYKYQERRGYMAGYRPYSHSVSRNIKFKILPSINASISISLVFLR